MILTGKKHPKIKLQRWRKIRILTFGSLVHQINSFQEVLKLEQIFQKNKVVTGKTPLFVIGPFCSRHSICLNIGFWQSSFEWKWCVFNLSSTKKHYSSFLKKVFVFEKICFKVKVLKTFETFTDCHIKTCRSLNGGLFWKSLVPYFRRTYALSVGFKMKTLRKSVFEC